MIGINKGWLKQKLKKLGYVSYDSYDEITKLIKENNFKNYAEVGVYRGLSAQIIRKYNPELEMHLIDSWGTGVFNDNKRDKMAKITETRWGEIYAEARKRNYHKYTTFHWMPSVEASGLFPDNSLDIVFIDAIHEKKPLLKDIKAWLPKVRIGGILCGHDYKIRFFGVMEAVHEYFGTDNVSIGSGHVWIYRKDEN